MLNRPYIGFDYHDARIYSVLALHWLNPDAYAQDPFFLFGSQDRYSLFSPIYGSLIWLTSLPTAAKIVMLVGGGLWVLAAVRLWQRLSYGSLLGAAAMLAMVSLSLNYSPNGNTFALNEAFPTARSWAMPLCAMSLAAHLSGQRLLGWGLVGIACLLHPLLGVWAFAAAVLFSLPTRIGAALYLVTALSLAGLVHLGIGPFVELDPEWLRFLRTYTWDLTLADGIGGRFNEIAFAVLMLCYAGWFADEKIQRRLYWATAIVAISGYGLSWVCTHLYPAELLMQAQPWRSIWLAFLLLPFACAQCLSRLWRHEANLVPWWQRPTAIFALFAGLLLIVSPSTQWLIPLGMAAWAMTEYPAVNRYLRRYVCWLQVLLLCSWGLLLPIYWLELGLLGGALLIPGTDQWAHWIGFFLIGGCGPGFIAVAFVLITLARLRVGVCLLLAPLVAIFTTWDDRSTDKQKREVYISQSDQALWRQHIKSGDVILWGASNRPSYVWYSLGTAHYASPVQATGRVFSRKKTEELLRRAGHIRASVLMQSEEAFNNLSTTMAATSSSDPFDFPSPTVESVPTICQDVALDWIVFEGNRGTRNGGVILTSGDGGRQWSLYRCQH